MKKIVITFILVLGVVVFAKAQSSINDYKYVIVEKQFHFQNAAHEYNLNNLTRFLFRKYGFNPILDSEVFPKDLRSNYCLALKSEIIVKGAFRTKATIVLKDCDNNIIFTSAEGITKEKDLEKAFNIAIRKAFESFNNVNYKYTENKNILAKAENTENVEQDKKAKKKIEILEAEIKELKEKKEITKIEIKEKAKVEKKKEEITEITFPKIVKKSENIKPFLQAKAITNGFELINNKSNKVDYIIYKTNLDNAFIIKGKSGIIYKKGNNWIREYVEGNKTIIESLDIRF